MPKVTLEGLRDSRLRVLIFGPPGTGKTTLAGSAVYVPQLLPIFYADCESGAKSIVQDLADHWDKVTLWGIAGLDDVAQLSEALFNPRSSYKTIIIDSLTELHALFMAQVLESHGRKQGTPQQQDYGEVSNTILRLLRRVVRENTKNLIVTASDAQSSDEASGVMYTSPDITGKLDYRVTRYFDAVGYLTSDRVKTKQEGVSRELTVRRLQLEPYGRVRAKVRLMDRTVDVHGFLENPTMQHVYDLVLTGASDALRPTLQEDADPSEEEEVAEEQIVVEKELF